MTMTTTPVRLKNASIDRVRRIADQAGISIQSVVEAALEDYLGRVESEGRLVFSISRQPPEKKARAS